MLPVGFDQIKALIPKKSGFMKGLKAFPLKNTFNRITA